MANVSIIPATKRSVQNGGQLKMQNNIRVAAYCRVSTGDESQQTSYTTQKAFYTSFITSKPGWRFAGIYADEALSGTSRAHRVEFNRMMDDAKAGRIDYIVSKSISRFARNTVDTLTCIRELRQLNPPVGVFFEKENIDTLDATGELILTILSALAQDESRSISDNIRWALQRKFQRGSPQINLKRMIGYDMGPDGEWIINSNQAATVRYIFERYLLGLSATKIAAELNEMGRPTVNGKKWAAGSVMIILRNEKYVGDIEMQKTITKDFLTHRSSKNSGEAPRYYIENHHVAIIDRLTWDKVQAMMYNKPNRGDIKTKEKKTIVKRPFVNLVCGTHLPDGEECGAGFFRLTYTNVASGYTDERSLQATGEDGGEYLEKYTFAFPVWRCKRKAGVREGEEPKTGTLDQKKYCRSKLGRMTDAEREAAEERCPSELYHEVALEQSFMEMLYRLKYDYETKGDGSDIVRMFKAAYDKFYRKVKNSAVSAQRIEALDDQVKELEVKLNEIIGKQVVAMREAAMEQNENLKEAIANGDLSIGDLEMDIRNGLTASDLGTRMYSIDVEEGSVVETYNTLANEIRKCMDDLRKERSMLENEQGELGNMKKNFDFFIDCLKQLPEQNTAGMPLKVYGLNVQSSAYRDEDGNPTSTRKRSLKLTPELIAEAPDLLHFEKGIYCAFIEKETVKGDVVEFKTTFGVTLTTVGNRRTLNSFRGFKRCNMDGTVEYVDAPYKVYGFSIQYRRYLTMAAKRERKDAV